MRLSTPSSLLLFTLAALAGFLVLGVALAQGTAAPTFLPGVPAEYQAAVLSGLGLVSGFVTYLLTAVYKRLKKTTGVTTVQVSAVLSVVVSLGFTLWQAYLTRGETPWYVALLVAVWAFVQSNASWIARVQSGVAANRATGVESLTSVIGQPLLGLPALTSGVGDVLANPLLEAAIKMALHAAGLPTGSLEVLKVAAELGPDFFDGNAMLSTEHLNTINAAVLDAKARILGGLK